MLDAALESGGLRVDVNGVDGTVEVWSASTDGPDVDDLDPIMAFEDLGLRTGSDGVDREGRAGGTKYFFAQEKTIEGGASTLSLRTLCTSGRSSLQDGDGSACFFSLLCADDILSLADGASSSISLLFLLTNDTSGEVDGASIRVVVIGRYQQRKVKWECGGCEDSSCEPGAGSSGARVEKRLSINIMWSSASLLSKVIHYGMIMDNTHYSLPQWSSPSPQTCPLSHSQL